MEEQDPAFREKFGREPSPEGPIFSAPDADQPQFLTESQQKKAIARWIRAGSAWRRIRLTRLAQASPRWVSL